MDEDTADRVIAQHNETAGLLAVLEAARCIRHWHDTMWNAETQQTEGMVVSAEHVRLLWAAIEAYDALPKPR
jgi:hypothetical protein